MFRIFLRFIWWSTFVLLILLIIKYINRNNTKKPEYVGLPQINNLFSQALPETTKDSKGERKCREILQEFYHRPFPKESKMFRNPETGRFLELDCYNKDLRLALEYNGTHHYQDRKQARRDVIKRMWCDQNNIYLIPVPHHIPFAKLYNYIAGMLPPVLDAYLADDATRVYVREIRQSLLKNKGSTTS